MPITTMNSTGSMNSEMAAPCDDVTGNDADLITLETQHRGGAHRTAIGQEQHDRQVGEGEHDAEDQADGDDRQDHRHDDLVVAAPEAGAVHRRRVDDVLRHRGDAGQEDDDREREKAPGVDDDDAEHSEMRRTEPVRHLLPGDDAGRDQAPVDDAVERIEHPLPGNGRQRDRHRPGQDDQRPDDPASRERLQQQERAELAEDEAEGLRSEGEKEGIPERVQEHRIAQDLFEIRQSHEAPRRIVDRIGADRIIDGQQERQADQQQHIEHRRRDQNRAEHIAAIHDETEARDRRGDDGFGNVDHRLKPPFNGG